MISKKPTFMIIDDDDEFRQSILESPILSNYANLIEFSSCETAYKYLEKNHNYVDLVLLDYFFRQFGEGNQMNGFDLLEKIVQNWSNIPVIIMSGVVNRGEIAIKAIKKLAYQFLDKPFDFDYIIKLYETFTENKILNNQNIIELKEKLSDLGFITENQNFIEKIDLGIESLKKKQKRIILINGETGSGKTYLAKQIHKIVTKSYKEPILVHCSSLGKDVNTIRDYLFGHIKDAFTGATKDKHGIFDASSTIICDDIQHITDEAQKILLEVFQDWKYSPFGKESIKKEVKSRVIVTSTYSPDELLKIGFLEEFVNRISAEVINVPPLRDRVEDIPHLMQSISQKYENRKIVFESSLIEYFKEHYKFKNIRTLEQDIDNLIIHSNSDTISFDVLRKLLSIKQTNINEFSDKEINEYSNYNLEKDIEEFRLKKIQSALKNFNGNIKKASEALGYRNHNGLVHWIKKLGIDVQIFK